MDRTLKYIPIAKIKDAGENPRQSIDKKPLEELVASIKEQGVLQPILVARQNGGFTMVAGYRRLAAAKKAGLKDIPAMIEEGESNVRAAALTENIIREDLTPLEEAQALAQLQEETGDGVRELARRIGKGKDWVSDRLRLAKLPEKVQDRVAAGDIGLQGVPALARVAEKVSPAAAEAVVAYAAKDQYNGRQLDAGHVGYMLVSVARSVGILPLGWQGVPPAQLPIDSAAKKEIVAAVKELGPKPGRYGTTPRHFTFNENMAGAAKKAGALLELDGYKFLNDQVWIEKQARAQLATWLKEPKAAKPSKEELDAENARKSQEQAEAERRHDTLVKANLELGKNLVEKIGSVEVDLGMARLFASLVLDPESEYADALLLVDERLQVADEPAEGEPTRDDMFERVPQVVKEDLEAATTPGEVFAIALRVLIADTYAKDPDRAYHYRYRGLPQDAQAQVEAIAKKERIVPKVLKDEAAAK